MGQACCAAPTWFSAEFKRDAVELVLTGGKSVAEAARDLGIYDSTLGDWVKQGRIDRGQREGLSTEERARLKELEQENAKLRRERDLLGRDFTPGLADQRWTVDITYMPTDEGWLYLAAVLDVGSRRVLGYVMASHLRTDLVADCLDTAVAARGGDVAGVIFHSDRDVNTPVPSAPSTAANWASTGHLGALGSAGAMPSRGHFSGR